MNMISEKRGGIVVVRCVFLLVLICLLATPALAGWTTDHIGKCPDLANGCGCSDNGEGCKEGSSGNCNYVEQSTGDKCKTGYACTTPGYCIDVDHGCIPDGILPCTKDGEYCDEFRCKVDENVNMEKSCTLDENNFCGDLSWIKNDEFWSHGIVYNSDKQETYCPHGSPPKPTMEANDPTKNRFLVELWDFAMFKKITNVYSTWVYVKDPQDFMIQVKVDDDTTLRVYDIDGFTSNPPVEYITKTASCHNTGDSCCGGDKCCPALRADNFIFQEGDLKKGWNRFEFTYHNTGNNQAAFDAYLLNLAGDPLILSEAFMSMNSFGPLSVDGDDLKYSCEESGLYPLASWDETMDQDHHGEACCGDDLDDEGKEIDGRKCTDVTGTLKWTDISDWCKTPLEYEQSIADDYNSPEKKDGSDACCGDDDFNGYFDTFDPLENTQPEGWISKQIDTDKMSMTLTNGALDIAVNSQNELNIIETTNYIQVKPSTSYLFMLDHNIKGMDSGSSVIAKISWFNDAEGPIESPSEITLTENSQDDKFTSSNIRFSSPPSAKKAKIIIDVTKVKIGADPPVSTMLFDNIRLIQSGDEGYVSNDGGDLCYRDTGWSWESAKDPENSGKIFTVGKTDFINDGEKWNYCNADGEDLFGDGTKGALPIPEWGSFTLSSTANLQPGLTKCTDPALPWFCPTTPTDYRCVISAFECNKDGDDCNDGEEILCGRDLSKDDDEKGCTINGKAYICRGTGATIDVTQGPSTNDYYMSKDECTNSLLSSCWNPDIEQISKESTTENTDTCTDNNDNDNDGFTDWQDADCCTEHFQNLPETSASRQECLQYEYDCADVCTTGEHCLNGKIDNDENGFANCDDSYCKTSYAPCMKSTLLPNQFTVNNIDASFLCYELEERNIIDECCRDGKCFNHEKAEKGYDGNYYVDTPGSLHGTGGMTHSLKTHDIIYFDLNGNVIWEDRVRIVKFGLEETIRANQDWTNNKYTNIELDIAFTNGIWYLSILNSKEEELFFTDNLKQYSMNGFQNNRWHHIIIPLADFKKDPIDAHYLKIFAPKPQDQFAYDNVFLRIDDNGNSNRYCTGGFGNWITSLNPPEGSTKEKFGPYHFSCDAQLSFGWTGTKCCGAETTYEQAEFWEDELHGCWRGYIVKRGNRISDVTGIPEEHPDLIYTPSGYKACINDFSIANDETYTAGSYSTKALMDSAAPIELKGLPKCAISQSWYCSPEAKWQETIPGVTGSVYDNSLDDTNFGEKPHPPGMNLVKNGGFD